MITNQLIHAALTDYRAQFPDDAHRIAHLEDALETSEALATRSRLAGHATFGAAVINRNKDILHIRHRALGLLLLPGGHPEVDDATPVEAARREVAEETGLTGLQLLPARGEAPLQIDVHRIPDSPEKGEPEHWHFDFRYPFLYTGTDAVELQEEEVSGAAWVPVADVANPILRERLADLIADEH